MMFFGWRGPSAKDIGREVTKQWWAEKDKRKEERLAKNREQKEEASFIEDAESQAKELGVDVDEILSSTNEVNAKTMTQLEIDVAELKCQVDSMEKSIKDTNKKITAIRNQLRKEKGRKPL